MRRGKVSSPNARRYSRKISRLALPALGELAALALHCGVVGLRVAQSACLITRGTRFISRRRAVTGA